MGVTILHFAIILTAALEAEVIIMAKPEYCF